MSVHGFSGIVEGDGEAEMVPIGAGRTHIERTGLIETSETAIVGRLRGHSYQAKACYHAQAEKSPGYS